MDVTLASPSQTLGCLSWISVWCCEESAIGLAAEKTDRMVACSLGWQPFARREDEAERGEARRGEERQRDSSATGHKGGGGTGVVRSGSSATDACSLHLVYLVHLVSELRSAGQRPAASQPARPVCRVWPRLMLGPLEAFLTEREPHPSPMAHGLHLVSLFAPARARLAMSQAPSATCNCKSQSPAPEIANIQKTTAAAAYRGAIGDARD